MSKKVIAKGLLILLVAGLMYIIFARSSNIPKTDNSAAVILTDIDKQAKIKDLTDQINDQLKAIADLQAQIAEILKPGEQTPVVTPPDTTVPPATPPATPPAPPTTPTTPANTSNANEPSNMTLISNRPFDFNCATTRCEGGWYDEYKAGGLKIIQDLAAPASPPNIGQFTFPVGFKGGSGPGSQELDIPNPQKTLYVSTWIKFSANWQGHLTSTNKIIHFFLLGSGNKLYTNAYGSGSGRLKPAIGLQALAAPYQTSLSGGANVSPDLLPNVNLNVSIIRGQWQHHEILVTANTPGVADGSVEMWIDGVKTHDYKNIMFLGAGGSGKWQTLKYNPTWGGGGDSIISSQYIQMDDMYVSGTNTKPLAPSTGPVTPTTPSTPTTPVTPTTPATPPTTPPTIPPAPPTTPTTPPSTNTSNANEPAGMTLLTQRAFNCSTQSCEDGWGHTGVWSVVQDSTAPKSPSNVGLQFFPKGFAGGASLAVVEKDISLSKQKKTIYFSTYLKLSENWQGPLGGTNKLIHFFIGGSNRVFISARGAGGSILVPSFGLQGLAANYSDGRGVNAKSVNLLPNLGSTKIIRGQWQHYEVVLTANSKGVADGSAELWIDGTKVISNTGIMFTSGDNDSKWEGVAWSPTWGASGDSVKADQSAWIDDAYMSGK